MVDMLIIGEERESQQPSVNQTCKQYFNFLFGVLFLKLILNLAPQNFLIFSTLFLVECIFLVLDSNFA